MTIRTNEFNVSLTVPAGWAATEVPGAELAIELPGEGHRPSLAVFVRPRVADETLQDAADRIVGSTSAGLPLSILNVRERPLAGRPGLVAAGVRRHATLGVVFQTVALCFTDTSLVIVTGLCARDDAPELAGVLRDVSHSLTIEGN